MNKALKTVMFTEDCEDRMRPILTSEYISSEESDEENGVKVIRVRQLSWIRQKVQKAEDMLYREYKRSLP